MALRVPKSKFRDHFSIQTSPQNPQKATSGTKIGPQKVIFCHFFNFAYFYLIFPLARAVLSNAKGQRKECSNQKVEENKPALKLNVTLEYTCLELILDVLMVHQQCHRALMDILQTFLTFL